MSFHSYGQTEDEATPYSSPHFLHNSLEVLFRLIWRLSVACYFYFLGFHGWSIVWVIVPLLGSLYIDIFSFYTTKKLNLKKLRALMEERELILTEFKELPTWVFFPDVERAEWLNKILHQLWPTLNNFTRTFILETMEPKLRETMDSYMLKGFYFQMIELGSVSPKITGIKVFERTARNEIIMDLNIFYGGDCEFVFGVTGLVAGIKDLQIEGTMRIIMKPLMPTAPIIAGFKFFFIDQPDIDFCLTGITGILEMPVIRSKFRNVLESVVSSMIVLPNMCVFDLSETTEVISYLKTPKPKGVLRVVVVEGKDLIAQDLNGYSDPYVIARVGAEESKSQTISNSLNPVWNFNCEFVVLEVQGQKLFFHIWDEDYGKSDHLGNTAFDITSVRSCKYFDTWLPLEEVEHGSIHVELTWFNLTHFIKDLNETLNDNSLFESTALSSAVLVVFLESARDLPWNTDLPTPLAELNVDMVGKSTQKCLKTANPHWDEGFCFLVRNPHTSSLELKVLDTISNKQIGQLEFKTQILLERRNMMMRKQPFKLFKSGEKSEVVMSLSLKIMTINDVTVSQTFALSAFFFPTGCFISEPSSTPL